MSTQGSIDHDLLIELRTEFKGMRDDIKELKDNLVSRVTVLEEEKAPVKVTNDHEKRIRRLEYVVAVAIGAAMLLEFISRFYKG